MQEHETQCASVAVVSAVTHHVASYYRHRKSICVADGPPLHFHYSSGSQSGRYRPMGGGGITEVGANRDGRWKGALLLSQGGASR